MRTKKAYLLALSLLTFLALSSKSQAENNGRLRFAVMGCMHTGICDFADYEFAVKKIKSYHPDFVLFLGSMVDTVGEKAGKK